MQQNGTWYLHVLLVKSGYPVDPEDEDYSPQAIAHTSGCKTHTHTHTHYPIIHHPFNVCLQFPVFNKYRKRHVHNTVNLITGEADVAPGSLKVRLPPSTEGGGRTKSLSLCLSLCSGSSRFHRCSARDCVLLPSKPHHQCSGRPHALGTGLRSSAYGQVYVNIYTTHVLVSFSTTPTIPTIPTIPTTTPVHHTCTCLFLYHTNHTNYTNYHSSTV